MLYFDFKDYQGFQERFGMQSHDNGSKSRKNKILLAFVKSEFKKHNYEVINFKTMTEMKTLKKFVTCKDLLLAAFRVVGYFYSQKQLVEAYYKLDPNILDEREPGDPVLKFIPKYMI